MVGKINYRFLLESCKEDKKKMNGIRFKGSMSEEERCNVSLIAREANLHESDKFLIPLDLFRSQFSVTSIPTTKPLRLKYQTRFFSAVGCVVKKKNLLMKLNYSNTLRSRR